MNEFWNKRYNTQEYVYGEAPNQFFKKELVKRLPAKLLLPGEGEGRNAVFAATIGWDVTAFDPSIEGKNKAEFLAEKSKVKINYAVESYESAKFPQDYFEAVGLIYTHMPSQHRKAYHRKLASFLKPGGVLILEGFSKKQIKNSTGGPPNIEMLYSEEELRDDFSIFNRIKTSEAEIKLDEGIFHQGIASVIRFTGIK